MQFMDKIHATDMQYIMDLKATFKNNIDRINADWEEKFQRKMAEMQAEMNAMLRVAKMKKWCPNCLDEVKFDAGFDPAACSIACWKTIL